MDRIKENYLEQFNRGRGRREVLLDEKFSSPLWPWVLERSGTILYYSAYADGPNTQEPQLSVVYSLLPKASFLFSRAS